jgi:hypothetical protein
MGNCCVQAHQPMEPEREGKSLNELSKIKNI